MRIFVESIKRLYEKGKLTLNQVKKLYGSNKLSAEEYSYIVKNDNEEE